MDCRCNGARCNLLLLQSHYWESQALIRPLEVQLGISSHKCQNLPLRFEKEVSMNDEMKFLAKFGLGVIAVFGWFLGGVISSSTGMKKSKT